MSQRYTQEEVNAILRRAVKRQPLGDEMTREQMQAIAAEVGVSPDALDRAEAEWRQEMSARSLRGLFDAERRAEFRKHALSYAVLSLFLLGINLFATPHFFWVVFPILAFALGLFYDCLESFQTGPDADRAYERWLEKRERHEIPVITGPDTYASPPRRRGRR